MKPHHRSLLRLLVPLVASFTLVATVNCGSDETPSVVADDPVAGDYVGVARGDFGTTRATLRVSSPTTAARLIDVNTAHAQSAGYVVSLQIYGQTLTGDLTNGTLTVTGPGGVACTGSLAADGTISGSCTGYPGDMVFQVVKSLTGGRLVTYCGATSDGRPLALLITAKEAVVVFIDNNPFLAGIIDDRLQFFYEDVEYTGTIDDDFDVTATSGNWTLGGCDMSPPTPGTGGMGGAGGAAGGAGGAGGMGGMGGMGGSADCHALTLPAGAPSVESSVIAAPMPPTEFAAFPVTLVPSGPRVLIAERRWRPNGSAGEVVSTQGTVTVGATSFDELYEAAGTPSESSWTPSADGKTLTETCPSMTDFAVHVADTQAPGFEYQHGLYFSVEEGNGNGFWRAYVDPTVACHVMPMPGAAQIIDDTILSAPQPAATGGSLTAGTYVLTEWNKFGPVTGDAFAFSGFVRIEAAQGGTQRVSWTLFYGPHHQPRKSRSGFLDYDVSTETPSGLCGSLPSAVTFTPDSFSASPTELTLHSFPNSFDLVFQRLP